MKVIFLKHKNGELKNLVSAIFLDKQSYSDKPGIYPMYDQINGHSEGVLHYMKGITTLAGITEYFPVLQELIDKGYENLDITYQS